MSKRKNKKKLRINMTMASVALVSVVIAAGFHVQSRGLEDKIDQYREKNVEMEEKINDERKRTQDIDELSEYMKTDEFAKEIANKKLGLVGDDQIIFKENK